MTKGYGTDKAVSPRVEPPLRRHVGFGGASIDDRSDLRRHAEAAALTPGQQSVLAEAARIVGGARQGAYGSPEDNFARIARFWTAHFANTGRAVEVTATDVSSMMRLMKEARLNQTPNHRDSLVDIIGYVLTQVRTQDVE